MGMVRTGSLSIAHGKIASGVTSEIHVLPCVDQVTYVLDGDLRITMQDRPSTSPYERVLSKGQASMCRAGTALQFANSTQTDLQVLYVVSRAIEITSQVTEFAAQREAAIARMSA